MSSLATSCPDVGRWRAWLDEEVADADSESDSSSTSTSESATHLAACTSCQRLVRDLRHTRDLTALALGGLAPPRLPAAAEVAAARARLAAPRAPAPTAPVTPLTPTPTRPSQEEKVPVTSSPMTSSPMTSSPMTSPRLFRRWRLAAGSAAAALAVFAVALTPQGQALASQVLGQFRSQQLTVVEVSPQSQQAIQRALQTLSNFGTVENPGALGKRNEANQPSVSLAEASQRVGFPVTEPSALPAGVDKTPKVQVFPGAQMRFKFEAAKARAYLQSQGQAGVAIPQKFDGATLVVGIPTAAMLQYQASGTASREALVVVEAGEVTVGAEGNATLAEMRDFLLGLPGLPKETVDQIRAISDWQNTLPIPVPTDQVNWEKTTVQGHPGLLLRDNSGIGSAAILQANGHLYGFAGSLKADDLLNVANHTPLGK